MTSPEEEQRKKSAEAKAKDPDKPGAASNDAFSFVGQLIGDAKNLAVDAVAGQHSGDKVLSGITPQLAAQYQNGKDVQARIDNGAVKQNQLSETDRKNLEAYNNVRKSIMQVPLYDRDSLMRYVEKGIEQKAKTAPPEAKTATPAAKPTQPEVSQINKPAAKETNRPVVQESSKPATAKDVPAKSPIGKPTEQPVSKTSPGAPDTLDARKASAQSIQQTHKDLPGALSSQTVPDTKTGSVKPPQFAQPQERSISQPHERGVTPPQERIQPGDGKTVPLKAQSEPGQINTFKDKVEGPKTIPSTGDKNIRQDVDKQLHPSVVPNVKVSEQDILQRSRGAEHQQAVRGETQTSKPPISQTSASSAFERRTSGHTKSDNMRSVLEERVSFTSNQSAKLKSQEQLPGKAAGSAEILPSRAGSAESRERPAGNQSMQQRIALTEIKAALTPERLQKIVHTSQERFPIGLCWQNTFTRQDFTTNTKTGRQREISTSSQAPINRGVDVSPRTPSAASHGAFENTSSIAKPHQPGVIQPGIVQPGILQPGDSRPGGTHPGSIHTGSSPTGSRPELTQGSTERPVGSRSTQPLTPGANPQIVRDHKGGIVGEGQAGAMQNSYGMISADARILTFRGRLEDRYITGAEIALAAIIAAAGAKRVRFDELPETGKETISQKPKVQRIDAFMPNSSTTQRPNDSSRSAKVSASESPVPGLTTDLATRTPQRRDFVADVSAEQKERRVAPESFTSNLKTSDKRFITGAEIALAAIIASSGTARIRQTLSERPADDAAGARTNREQVASFKTKGSGAHTDSVPGAVHNLQTFKFSRETVLIGPGDTLVSIAERHCNNEPRIAWLIADINRSKLKETYVDGMRVIEVRSREALEVPTKDEIVAFLAARNEEYKPENLITIVIETQIDRELLDEHLGIFVEGGNKGIAVPANPSAAPVFQRTIAGADGSLALPSLNLESGNILQIASSQLMKLTQRALETGRKPFSKLRNSVKREKIKRRL